MLDIILECQAQAIAGNTLHAKMQPFAPYARRYFMPFVGGVFLGNMVRSHFGQPIEINSTVGSASVGSIYFEDAGDWPILPDGAILPDRGALDYEALIASKLEIDWTNTYNVTDTHGDDQLTNIVVTGAIRNQNVGMHPEPTRGRLYFTITLNADGDYVVAWWADSVLVATGTRTGNGALTCAEVNRSGLSVDCDLAYTVDVIGASAFIDLRWPAAYALNYEESDQALIWGIGDAHEGEPVIWGIGDTDEGEPVRLGS